MTASSIWIYPAVLATIISMTGLTWLARSLHDPLQPRTLSEAAAASRRGLLAFRLILFPCSALFGLTLLLYVAPHSHAPVWINVAALVMCLSEVVLGILPASYGWRKRAHSAFAYLMGIAMFALAVLFAQTLSDFVSWAEYALVGSMALLFVGMMVNRPRFITYELTYIYLSHLSIVLIVFSLAALV